MLRPECHYTCVTCGQLASSTLDASAKIYAGRVDAIHTEVYKVLSGLGRGASESQKSPGDLVSIFIVSHGLNELFRLCLLHLLHLFL